MVERLTKLAEDVLIYTVYGSLEPDENASCLFKGMLYTGGWDSKLQNRKSEILLYEHLINESRKSMPQKRYCGGSFAEGSEMRGSDHDNMFIYPNVMVTTKSNITYPSHDTVVFLMVNEGLRACYTQLCYLRGPWINQYDNQLNPLKCLEKKDDGKLYLLSCNYAKAQFTRIKSDMGLPKVKIEFKINGPCAAFKTGELMADYVFTLECNDWPPDAAEWKTRARKYEWPDEHLRKAVVNTKCSLVPIGNIASEDNERKFEWRISFLLGERQLMWSLNESQYFCFILLKKLKKHFIDPNHEDLISSFILKTTLFWEIEETGIDTWNEKTIIVKVRSCLNRLHRYVEEKTIPHYFARENNLFTGKDMNRPELLETISSLSQNLLDYIREDAEPIVWNENPIYCNWGQDKSFSRNYLYCNIENALHLCTLSDLERFENDLSELREPYILDEHKQTAKELLNLKFAMTLYTIYNNEPKNEKVEWKLNKIEQRYKEAKDVDAICGRLHLATFYFKQQRFKEVQTVINSIYENEVCLYDGGCSTIRFLQFNKALEEDRDYKFEIAHDVSFCLSGICAPDVVLALLRISDESIIRIHPLVYMYLLEFLISTESIDERRKALWKLSREVERSLAGHDTDIALNLGGYCYLVIGDRLNALHFFSRSLRIRPSVKNPCMFYGSIMLLFELGGRIVNALASTLL